MAPASIHFASPLHRLLLAFPIALYAGGLASDITYLNSEVVQWSHFAAWMIAGAQAFGALVLVFALFGAIRRRKHAWRGRSMVYLLLVVVMWTAGLINSFQHSRDGWSSVGNTGLVLSIVCTLAALVAGWIAYSNPVLREDAR
ncbi:hypothetical protein GRI97_04885 [Altererythrobacter xixiisoli]|uniref:DUF2231 domain-containing protein n=1 Tax=Croceibacterium xixiisoli TaxID=1476466 RepID=A0A6I4TUN4_9SPHN|nr:DUF2231 domain-containing protein [Croceibacterium xixiisoli]MXO98318.1 hypothetical protein [Croceibacterium xixiisoli]